MGAIQTSAAWTDAPTNPAVSVDLGDSVHFDPREFAAELGDLKTRARASVADAFVQELVPIAQAARAAWPVDTGRSRDGVSLTFRSGRGSFRAEIGDDVDYAWKINKGATARTLITQPVEDAQPRLGDAIVRGVR